MRLFRDLDRHLRQWVCTPPSSSEIACIESHIISVQCTFGAILSRPCLIDATANADNDEAEANADDGGRLIFEPIR